MQRIPVTGLVLLSLFLTAIPAAHGFQAGNVWVDANGKTHIDPTVPASATPAPPAYSAPANPGRPAAMQPVRAALPSNANRYSVWRDPAEGAFTVALPVGWQISGGTVRVSQLDAHYVVRAQSPSGGAQVFIDDPRILMRELPNRATQMMGIREGQVIPAGGGANLMVESYHPGAQMAAEYVQKVLCPAATMMHGGPIVDQTQALKAQFAPIAQAEGKTLQIDAGEVSFKCGDRAGYTYAITMLAYQPGAPVSIWGVYRIAGYLSTTEDSAAAAAAVNQALGTFQMDQGWLQRYAKECGDVAGNVIRESNAITQTTMQRSREMNDAMISSIENSRKNSNATMNAIEHSGSSSSNGNANGHDYNAQLQQKTVCDDVGRCQSVDASVTNWWSDCSGTFHAGSESGGAPPASQSACWSKGH